MNFVVPIMVVSFIGGCVMEKQIVVMLLMRGTAVCTACTKCFAKPDAFPDSIPCKENEFTCGPSAVKYCIPQNWTCDGEDDCGNGIDESLQTCKCH